MPPPPRWSRHELIEVITQRQIHAAFPAVRLSFCLLSRLVLLPCLHALVPSLPQMSSAPRPCQLARTGSTRVICPPAHNMRSADQGTAGRNKHHFRVPVIGRVRAPATPWRTARSAASRITTGRSHARLHPSSPHPDGPTQGWGGGIIPLLHPPRKLLSNLPALGLGTRAPHCETLLGHGQPGEGAEPPRQLVKIWHMRCWGNSRRAWGKKHVSFLFSLSSLGLP